MHLIKRFFRSLLARPLSGEEEAWVTSVLTPEELLLWRRFGTQDRRHTVGVARRVEARLSGDPGADRWVAAALLHDVGKLESGLGLPGRVTATVARGVLGRRRVEGWRGRRGWRGRLATYHDHGALGAAMIRRAGGRAEVARWAELHQGAETGGTDPAGTLPPRVVQVLHEADQD